MGGLLLTGKEDDKIVLFPRLRRRWKNRIERPNREKRKVRGEALNLKPAREKQGKPESGKTFKGQSSEAYCLECVEGHTMTALTEMRHAIDRYRTAGEMTEGSTEKVRVAIAELQGITEDVRSLDEADPEVRKGLQEILDEARWIRKEYGMSGKGLTRGYGDMSDLEELRNRILIMQNKAYDLVEKCPTCQIIRD